MASLEERATKAEARMSELMTRLDKIDGKLSGGGAGGSAQLREYQLDMLGQLKQLRAKMVAEGGAGSGSGGGGASAKEVDELKAANAKLEEENGKLNYRIKHLLRALDEAEQS